MTERRIGKQFDIGNGWFLRIEQVKKDNIGREDDEDNQHYGRAELSVWDSKSESFGLLGEIDSRSVREAVESFIFDNGFIGSSKTICQCILDIIADELDDLCNIPDDDVEEYEGFGYVREYAEDFCRNKEILLAIRDSIF